MSRPWCTRAPGFLMSCAPYTVQWKRFPRAAGPGMWGSLRPEIISRFLPCKQKLIKSDVSQTFFFFFLLWLVSNGWNHRSLRKEPRPNCTQTPQIGADLRLRSKCRQQWVGGWALCLRVGSSAKPGSKAARQALPSRVVGQAGLRGTRSTEGCSPLCDWRHPRPYVVTRFKGCP